DIHAGLLEEELLLEAEGTVEPGPGLGPEAMEAGPLSFSLSGSYDSRGRVSIRSLDLSVGDAAAELHGGIDLENSEVSAGLDLRVARLSGADVGLPYGDSGPLRLSADISGRASQPSCEARISAESVDMPGLRAGSFSAVLAGELPLDALRSFEGLSVRAHGEAEALSFPMGDKQVAVPEIRWSMETALEKGRTVAVQSLQISDGNTGFGFSGRLDPQDQSLEGRVEIGVKKLSSLPVNALPGLRGSMDLKARIKGSGLSRELHAEVEADFHQPGPLPSLVSALAGDLVRLESTVEVSEGPRIAFPWFFLKGAAAEAAGEGEVDLSNGLASIGIGLDIPELEELSDVLGRSIQGRGRIEIDARGPLDGPEGRATVAVESGIGEAQGESDFMLGDKRLHLKEIVLSGPGIAASGDMRVDLHTAGLDGSLTVKAPDLRDLASYGAEGLSGSAVLDTVFSTQDGGQDALMKLSSEDVSGPFGRLGRAEIKCRVRDILGGIKGDAEIDLSLLSFSPSLMVEKVQASMQGDRNGVKFSLDAEGNFKQPFNLAFAGRWSGSGAKHEFLITELSAVLGPYRAALEAPSTIEWGEDSLVLHKGSFELETGHVSFAGRVSQDLDVEVLMESLPLGLLQVLGIPEIHGLINGSLRLQGAPEAPEGILDLDIKGVRPSGPLLQGLPEMEFSSSVVLDQGLVQAGASLEGGGQRLLEARMEVPVEAGFMPFEFSIPSGGGLRGTLTMDMDLRPVPGWFGLDEHRLTGGIAGEIFLQGTADSPGVEGRIRLYDGAYEYIPGGIMLRGLELKALVEENQVVLERLSAGDGGEGALVLRGRLGPDPEEGMTFEAGMEMTEFKLIRLDELTAVTGGEFEIRGSQESASVGGRVRVDSVEARIPERLPPRITELQVEEINVPPDQRTALSDKKPAQPLDISLDLGIVVPGRAFVRGRGLDSEWEGELAVTGKAAQPAVRGELSIVRGHYNFLGRRFELESGTLSFDGAYPPSPAMNVTAVTSTADMT
ncbi:MAG: translocation/assembly module TamB domain-containing protein, partial [Desulfobacteraceae bacterium]